LRNRSHENAYSVTDYAASRYHESAHQVEADEAMLYDLFV